MSRPTLPTGGPRPRPRSASPVHGRGAGPSASAFANLRRRRFAPPLPTRARMMTSCVVRHRPLALKRLRSDEACADAPKVAKLWTGSSPRSSLGHRRPPAVSSPGPSAGPSAGPSPAWPDVRGCGGVRRAMAFLHQSRRHAVLLMVQNHWERAMGVLEKIERATESVSRQRRRVVIDQANAQSQHGGRQGAQSQRGGRRAVRFRAAVDVAPADEMDRAAEPTDAPPREEMLVLRASRAIPHENLSEFWD